MIGCSGLTSITIGNGVTSIGDGAFGFCTGLTSIAIGSGVTRIGDAVFERCTNLTAITVDTNNSFYSSVNGVLFDKGQTTLIRYPGIGGIYTIPSSVTSIGSRLLVSARCDDDGYDPHRRKKYRELCVR